MTGLPQFNIPNFERVTAALRSLGHEVISPAEEDSPEVQVAGRASPDGSFDADGKLAGETWGDMLARDVKIIADHKVDAIFLMEGWERSRGARLEAFIGLLCDCLFMQERPPAIGRAAWDAVPADYVIARIYDATKEKIRAAH
jgi:hypothetical protein